MLCFSSCLNVCAAYYGTTTCLNMELVTDANFDCSGTGFSLQAMDSSHVTLVALLLRSEGFEHYRCDRNLSMGMNLGNMAKMLRCAGSNDIITIKADDGSDTVTFMFESSSKRPPRSIYFLPFAPCGYVGDPDLDGWMDGQIRIRLPTSR